MESVAKEHLDNCIPSCSSMILPKAGVQSTFLPVVPKAHANENPQANLPPPLRPRPAQQPPQQLLILQQRRQVKLHPPKSPEL